MVHAQNEFKISFLDKLYQDLKKESCNLPDLLDENYDSATMIDYQEILPEDHNYELEKNDCKTTFNGWGIYTRTTLYDTKTRTLSVNPFAKNFYNFQTALNSKPCNLTCQIIKIEKIFDDNHTFDMKNREWDIAKETLIDLWNTKEFKTYGPIPEDILFINTRCNCHDYLMDNGEMHASSNQIHNCWNFDHVAKERRFTEKNKKNKRFNIVIQGFDSLSWAQVRRKMPKFVKIMKKYKENFFRSKRYNVVGKNTRPNLFPFLLGHEWPGLDPYSDPNTIFSQYYRPFLDGAVKNKYFNNNKSFMTVEDLPHIFKIFQAANYFTSMYEDMPRFGILNWNTPGVRYGNFTDFYSRAIFKSNALDDLEATWPRGMMCYGKQSFIEFKLNDWGSDLLNAFKRYQNENNSSTPLFQFSFTAAITHDNENTVGLIDTKTAEYFDYWLNPKNDDDTIFIFFSDHGFRTGGSFAATQQAKFEHRNPPLIFRFPDRFKEEYPEEFENAVYNLENFLVTTYDIRETLIDLVKLDDRERIFTKSIDKVLHEFNQYYLDEIPIGRSLFTKNFGKDKNCQNSKVPLNYCNCINGIPFMKDDDDDFLVFRNGTKNYFGPGTDEKRSELSNILLRKLEENTAKRYLAFECERYLNHLNLKKLPNKCLYWELKTINNGQFQILIQNKTNINLVIELDLTFDPNPTELDGKFACKIEWNLFDDQVFREISKMENLSIERLVGMPSRKISLDRTGRYGSQYKDCVPPKLVYEMRETCCCKDNL